MRIMDRECSVLFSEIERLEMFRKMQDMRLENLINLVCDPLLCSLGEPQINTWRSVGIQQCQLQR